MNKAKSVLLAGAVAFGWAAGAQAETVKVGVISSFSGPFALYGKQMQCGVDAFQKAYGKAVNGNEVEVVYRDDGGPNANRARQAAQELIVREKVKFLGGFVFSPNVAAAAPLVDQAGIPLLIFASIQPDLTDMSPNVFRLSYTIDQVTKPLADWAASSGIHSVVTVVSDFGPGHAGEARFAKEFEAAGGTIVERVRIPLSTNDFSPYFERILQEKPDAIYIFAPGGAVAPGMIRTWAERGLRDAGIKLLLTGETEDIHLPLIGDSAVGAVSSMMYTLRSVNAENDTMTEALREVCGPDAVPDWSTLGAYDGMRVIYDTLAALGPDFDIEKARDLIGHMRFDSPRGPIALDPDTHELVQNVYLREVRKADDGSLYNADFETMPEVRDPWHDEKQ